MQEQDKDVYSMTEKIENSIGDSKDSEYVEMIVQHAKIAYIMYRKNNKLPFCMCSVSYSTVQRMERIHSIRIEDKSMYIEAVMKEQKKNRKKKRRIQKNRDKMYM